LIITSFAEHVGPDLWHYYCCYQSCADVIASTENGILLSLCETHVPVRMFAFVIKSSASLLFHQSKPTTVELIRLQRQFTSQLHHDVCVWD